MKLIKQLANISLILSISILVFACGPKNTEPKFPGTVAFFSAEGTNQQVTEITAVDRGNNQCQFYFKFINVQQLGQSAGNAMNPTLAQGITSASLRIVLGTQKSGGAALPDFFIPGGQNSGLGGQALAQFFIDQQNPAGNNLTPTINIPCGDIKVLQFLLNGSLIPTYVQNL